MTQIPFWLKVSVAVIGLMVPLVSFIGSGVVIVYRVKQIERRLDKHDEKFEYMSKSRTWQEMRNRTKNENKR